MKILHIANFSYNSHGAAFYNCDRKISAGWTRRGHFVYEFSLRDMARMGTIFRTKRLGAGWANAEVLRVCEHLQPDLVLLGHAQILAANTLKEIRRLYPNTRIAMWYVDWLSAADKVQYMQTFAPYLDALFATTGGTLLEQVVPASVTRAFIPNPVERSVESLQNFKKQQFSHELIFCGTVGDDIERRVFMEKIQHDLAHLPLAFHGLLGQPQVEGVDYTNALSNTRMGLNYSRRNDIPLYSSDRIAQLTGNGLLTFSPRIPEFTKLYAEDELVYFDHVDDLIEKVNHYHRYPEQAAQIAEKGWQRAHSTCAVERVVRFMEETLLNQGYSEQYEWSDHVFFAQ